MKLLNIEVQGLYDFLLSLELSGKQNRMRTRFCKLLANQLQQIEEDKADLIDQFVAKDEDGKPIFEKLPDGKVKYHLRDTEGFAREFNILMREEFVIEETEEVKDMLLTVKDIVLNLDKSFSGQEALQYDRYCEVFENIYNN